MKTDGEEQFFSNVDKFCLQKSGNPPVGVTHSWWSNLVCQINTALQRIAENSKFLTLNSVTISGIRLCTARYFCGVCIATSKSNAVFLRIAEAKVSEIFFCNGLFEDCVFFPRPIFVHSFPYPYPYPF